MAKKQRTKIDLSGLVGNKRELAERLLEKAEFMESELNKLQEIIREKGWTETYQNGQNQFGLKKSSEGETYNQMIKNYNATIKQLLDIIPDESEKEKSIMESLEDLVG